MTTSGLYLAVMPRYRRACMEQVRERLEPPVRVWVSDAHLDASGRTDADVDWYEPVRMVRLPGRRAFLQVGAWREALGVGTLVVDLNPRSLSAWLLLLSRRLLRRRTLVWGHVYPRAGAGARTASLRILMRRLADGTVSYTRTDAVSARADLPGSPVWVATNALYPRSTIVPAEGRPGSRDAVLYVGRFVAEKKVELLVRAFARAHARVPDLRLVLVGDGALRSRLQRLVHALHVDDRVTFEGWVDDPERLRAVYARTFAAVSPGFAGLSLTQAAGFGVPTLVSRDEPHSPEIELAEVGAVRWFATDDEDALATAIVEAWGDRGSVPDERLSRWVAESYSAESMAAGLVAALSGELDPTEGRTMAGSER